MKLKGNGGWALFLIGCGALILLANIGWGLGHLLSYLFPIVLLGLGYIGIRNGSKFFGWAIFIIGLFALFNKFTGLFAIILAGVLIFFGVALLKRRQGSV